MYALGDMLARVRGYIDAMPQGLDDDRKGEYSSITGPVFVRLIGALNEVHLVACKAAAQWAEPGPALEG